MTGETPAAALAEFFTQRQGQGQGQERVEALADIPHGGRRKQR